MKARGIGIKTAARLIRQKNEEAYNASSNTGPKTFGHLTLNTKHTNENFKRAR